MIPADLRYTKEHEWVRVEGDVATVGITAHAADQLGDIVFVELPAAGTALAPVRDLRRRRVGQGRQRPVRARRRRGRSRRTRRSPAAPEVVNSDPYGAGWMLKIRLADPAQVDAPARPGRLRGAGRGGLTMAYGPHTAGERARMLDALGIASVDELFEAIPPGVRAAGLDLPAALTELELMAHLGDLAGRNRTDLVELPRGRRLPPPPPAGRRPDPPAGRVLHGLHAVPAGDQPGDAADDLRVPVAAGRADRHGRRLGLPLRRRGGDRRGGPHDLPGDEAASTSSSRASVHPHYRETFETYFAGANLTFAEVPARRRRAGRRDDRPGRPRADARRPGAPGGRRRRRPSRRSSACSSRWRRSAAWPTRPARSSSAVVEPVSLAVLAPPGGLRRRHRGGGGPAAGHAAPVRRALPRDRGLPRGADPPDPRPPHRDDRRPRRQAGLRHDAARPRAGHPARAGGQQHLHEPGPLRPGRVGLPRGARARRAPRRGGHRRRPGGRAGGGPRRRRRAARSTPGRTSTSSPSASPTRSPSTAACWSAGSWPASRWPSSSPATRRSPTGLLVCATEVTTSDEIERLRRGPRRGAGAGAPVGGGPMSVTGNPLQPTLFERVAARPRRRHAAPGGARRRPRRASRPPPGGRSAGAARSSTRRRSSATSSTSRTSTGRSTRASTRSARAP